MHYIKHKLTILKDMEVSIVMGVPKKWMVYFRENPIYKLDDLGYLGVPPFMESSICESPKLGPGICGLSPGEQCGALVLAGGS